MEHISDSGADDKDDLDDAGSEFAASKVDVYNSARLAWLSSNLTRAGYCDEAARDLGMEDADTFDRIGIGQYAESLEVFESVRQSLADRMDDLA